jgi:hypothetical protein
MEWNEEGIKAMKREWVKRMEWGMEKEMWRYDRIDRFGG